MVTLSQNQQNLNDCAERVLGNECTKTDQIKKKLIIIKSVASLTKFVLCVLANKYFSAFLKL